MAANFFERYCDTTTIHGFKYLVGKQNFVQKIFWVLMIIFSIFCTLSLILSLIDQIAKNPIVIYRYDTAIDVTKIPFPAYTISEIGASNDTEMDSAWGESFYIAATIVPLEFGLCRTVNFAEPADFLRDEVDEKRIFQGIYDWNDKMYPDNAGEYNFEPENETRPFMTTSANLGFRTRMFYDKYGKRKQNRFGIDPVLLMIHSPFELPTTANQKFTLAGLNQDTFWVTPQLNTIDDTMIGMEPHERNCFLPHEKNLTLYKVYNVANCKAECKSNFIAAECGCVPEYIVANVSISVCNPKSQICAGNADLKFNNEIVDKCDCLPSCEHLSYTVERSKTDFMDTNTLYILAYPSTPELTFSIKFKSGDHFPIVRRKHFTVIEILAFVGGLLGLFMGISVITFSEAIDLLLQPLFSKLSPVICFPKTPFRFTRRPNRISKCISKLSSYFSFYLKESSVHSFNFIVDAKNCFGSIFWLLSFCVSMTGCVLMILQLYRDVDFKAVNIIIDDQVMDVSEMPFPAVTIINTFRSVRQKFLSKIRFFKERDILEFNGFVHANGNTSFPNKNADGTAADMFSRKYFRITELEKKTFQEMFGFSRAAWFIKNHNGSFGSMFKVPFAETVVKEGLAFTFNILDRDELLQTESVVNEFHYNRNVVLSDHLKNKSFKFPWHATVAESLELEIRNDHELTFYWEAFTVHPTDEMPMMVQKEKTIGFGGGRHLEVLITPSVIRSDDSLRLLAPSDRSCYFEDERKLRFFKIYTKHNCEIECLSNVSRERCHCVPEDIVSDPNDRTCLVYIWLLHLCIYTLEQGFKDLKPSAQLLACSCLPTCDSISYSVDVRESHLRGNEFQNITQLSFKFAVENFYPMRREMQITVIDFLSYVGGLLGLFAGISVLSFFEIFYFFTLRVVTNVCSSFKRPQHVIVTVKPIYTL